MAPSENHSVTRLIDLARQGDGDAKVQLWERYVNLLYDMARDGPNEAPSGAADTSDVVAEVKVRFFTAAELLVRIQSRGHFQNLLRRMVRGKKIDLIRQEGVRPTVPLAEDSGQAPIAPDVPDFVLSDLRDMLNALPMTLHETALTFMECGNERDAAAALGISRHEVRNRMSSIREIWSEMLGEE